jgi:hypothetical protein
LSRARQADAYAGIGSRDAPPEALAAMHALAARFARAGLTMRTGASPGADQAFLRGAASARGAVELYLPWPEFEAQARATAARGARVFELAEPVAAATALAQRFHPRWEELEPKQRRLRARDVHVVLGVDLSSPAAFVICWTPDGSVDGSSAAAGGTGQALRVAAHHDVPVVNLATGTGAREALERLPGA